MNLVMSACTVSQVNEFVIWANVFVASQCPPNEELCAISMILRTRTFGTASHRYLLLEMYMT